MKGSDYMSKNEQKDIDLPLYYHVSCLKSQTQKPNTIQSDIFWLYELMMLYFAAD